MIQSLDPAWGCKPICLCESAIVLTCQLIQILLTSPRDVVEVRGLRLPLALGLILVLNAPAEANHLVCFGQQTTKDGTDAGETINGTANNDVIDARGGPDTVYARAGSDRVCGGNGSDYIFGQNENDLLRGRQQR